MHVPITRIANCIDNAVHCFGISSVNTFPFRKGAPFSATIASAAGRNGSRCSTVDVLAPDTSTRAEPCCLSWAALTRVACEMMPCTHAVCHLSSLAICSYRCDGTNRRGMELCDKSHHKGLPPSQHASFVLSLIKLESCTTVFLKNANRHTTPSSFFWHKQQLLGLNVLVSVSRLRF